MSQSLVPPSVLRPRNVSPDCRWDLICCSAQASIPHVTIADNVSTGALSLSCQKTSIALKKLLRTTKYQAKKAREGFHFHGALQQPFPLNPLRLGGPIPYSGVGVRDTYHTQSRLERLARRYRQKSNLKAWTAYIP